LVVEVVGEVELGLPSRSPSSFVVNPGVIVTIDWGKLRPLSARLAGTLVEYHRLQDGQWSVVSTLSTPASR
jgi:hypothetical protein